MSYKKKKANAKYICQYLTNTVPKKKRWTKQAVAGLLGNMDKECRMNPGQWENWKKTTGMDSGYGICQWTPSGAFFKWSDLTATKANKLCKSNPQKLLKKQLEYMQHTMVSNNYDILEWYGEMGVSRYYAPYNMTAKKYIKSKKKPYDLAMVFHGAYLRSADSKSTVQKDRAKKADYWYKRIK